jgi:hypothetical protein
MPEPRKEKGDQRHKDKDQDPVVVPVNCKQPDRCSNTQEAGY